MEKKQKAKKLFFKPPKPVQNMTDLELDGFATDIYDNIMSELLGEESGSQQDS